MGLSALPVDEAYSSVARLLAADSGLVVNTTSMTVASTLSGSVEQLFKSFGLQTPVAVLVSN